MSDWWNARVQIFDNDGNFLGKFGSYGSGNGQFNNPLGVLVHSSGRIYITDYYNCRVQIFESDGTYVSQFGKSGTGNGQFDGPYDIEEGQSGRVYVCDHLNHRVQIFESDGTYVDQFGSSGTGKGQFNRPAGIDFSSSGQLYITDMLNHRVQIFASDGTYINKFGSLGSGDSQFRYPAGVTLDSFGYIHVADRDNHRLQVFDHDLKFIGWWGGCVEHGDNIAHWHGPSSGHNPQLGYGDGELGGPYDVAFDSYGYTYITGGLVIQKLNVTYIYVTIDIDPDTLNLNSKDKWVTCYIIPADPYQASDILPEKVKLEDSTTYPGGIPIQHSDLQKDVLMVKFDRQELISYIKYVLEIVPPDPCVPLTVSGSFYDGACFEGIDEIRVIDEKKKD